MKIADYNQMMAYLTRPEPLPQPKPEELLKIQEQNRKDRLRKTMEELDPVLMDESLDFIEREELKAEGGRIGFDKGGSAQVYAHLDSLPAGTEIDLNYVRKFIEDNNINANAENVYNQFAEVDYKRTNVDGKKVFKY